MTDTRPETDIEEAPDEKKKFLKWAWWISRLAVVCILAIYVLSGCRNDGGQNNEDKIEFVKKQNNGELTGTINGHNWVDMGLPSGLKWATCNVGASEPEEFGNYYAWGETEPKDEYTTINSLTYKVPFRKLKKAGIVDEAGILTKKHDVASTSWGGSWRMPTDEEFQELISSCTWNFASFNGINGYLVTGPNKKNIFLPAAGFQQNTTEVNIGDFGDYWSSSIVEELTGVAHSLGYSSKSHGTRRYSRYAGRSIRPVTE